MHDEVRNLRLVIALALMALVDHRVCFGATAEPWDVEWKKTIAAAQKEEQLSLYGGMEISHADIIAAFNKEFPFIKIVSVSGRGPDILARIVSERRAGKYLVDLTASGPNGARMLYLNKMLDPIAPMFVLPEVRDVSKWYGGKHWYGDPEQKYIFMFEGTTEGPGISVNTQLTRPEEVHSYWDLLQPKWKGKILALDPRPSLPTHVVSLYHRPGLGPEFLRRFYTETEITFFRDRRQGTNWLATGRFPLCFLCRDIDKVAQQGLPVTSISADQLKEGAAIGGGASSVLTLVNRAPHPNAAKLFINWYLSRAGQSVWQRVMNVKEVESSDSMRIDISKDDVLVDGKRTIGKQYEVVGFVDPEPVQKLVQEVLNR